MAEDNQLIWKFEARVPSVTGAGQPMLSELLAALAREEWSERDIFGVHLAVEEALVNAIRHGNQADDSKHVSMSCQLRPDCLIVEIADEGEGFDPSVVPDCTAEENLDRPSGRGIMLMKNFMSRVEYVDGGNRVILEKRCTKRE